MTSFGERELVWVTSLATVVPVAALLRHALIETATARRAGALTDSKKDLIFAYLTGWAAYTLAGAMLVVAHLVPPLMFGRGVVLPYLAPVWAAWLSAVTAASWQHFVVRRQLRTSL